MVRHYAKENPVHSVDFGPLPSGLTHREVAEEEATRDFLKQPRQILSDVHDEILREDRPQEYNLIHGFKRLGSLFCASAEASTKSAEENLKLQKEVRDMTADLRRMTMWLKWLTIVLTILTAVTTYVVILDSSHRVAAAAQAVGAAPDPKAADQNAAKANDKKQ